MIRHEAFAESFNEVLSRIQMGRNSVVVFACRCSLIERKTWKALTLIVSSIISTIIIAIEAISAPSPAWLSNVPSWRGNPLTHDTSSCDICNLRCKHYNLIGSYVSMGTSILTEEAIVQAERSVCRDFYWARKKTMAASIFCQIRSRLSWGPCAHTHKRTVMIIWARLLCSAMQNTVNYDMWILIILIYSYE